MKSRTGTRTAKFREVLEAYQVGETFTSLDLCELADLDKTDLKIAASAATWLGRIEKKQLVKRSGRDGNNLTIIWKKLEPQVLEIVEKKPEACSIVKALLGKKEPTVLQSLKAHDTLVRALVKENKELRKAKIGNTTELEAEVKHLRTLNSDYIRQITAARTREGEMSREVADVKMKYFVIKAKWDQVQKLTGGGK